MDDDDDEIEVCGGVIQPRRWRWPAAVGATVNLAGNLGRAVTAWCDDMSTLIAQHVAVTYDRDDLITSARRDLESLPVIDE